MPATISISRFYVPAPSTLLQGPCNSLLGGALASRSAYRRMGSSWGHAKPSLKYQGQTGAAAGSVLKSEKNFSNVYPSSRQLSGQDATHSLLVPKDTLTHVTSPKLRQTQEQGKKSAAFGLSFQGPQKEQALEIMPLPSLHASFPQRKVRFKDPSARRLM